MVQEWHGGWSTSSGQSLLGFPAPMNDLQFLTGPVVGDVLGTGGQQVIAGMPTGRFSTPDEVATLVVLLASPKTANATGANYVIDGGLIKTM